MKIKLEIFDRDVLDLICLFTALEDESTNPMVLNLIKKLKPEIENELLRQSTPGRINKIANTNK